MICSSEEDSEEDEFTEIPKAHKKLKVASKVNNIIQKILNREKSGFFNSKLRFQANQEAFAEDQIPADLSFCLKDIIPFCYLDGHIFMGLTACGNFMISYKRSVDEGLSSDYNFSNGFKYELYFWIYVPHSLLSKYYNVCLFDDHSVDDLKVVTMTQWSSDLRTLIIHGASEIDDQDSFISLIRIPKMGCLDCKIMRDNEFLEINTRQNGLCIGCNLTIHTKYHYNESANKFNPKINLNCPNYIIMCENSFIHTVNVQLDLKKSRNLGCGTISSKYLNDSNIQKETEKKLVVVEAVIASKSTKDCVIGLSNIVPAVGAKNTPKLSIVDEILADFSEYDIDEYQNTSKNVFIKNVDGISPSTSSLHHDSIEELVLTCGSTVSGGTPEAKTPHKNGFGGKVTNVELVSTNRILKSQDRIKNESPESLNCYDFSEETEKCEKISIFRKRRLADKKYEFSEDNTENIIPFNRTRSRSAKFGIIPPASPSRAAQHSFHNFYEMQAHSHRASPSHGFFRSPCGSPVSNRYLRSPPGLRSPNYYPYRSPSSSVATTSAYSKSFTVFSPPRQFNRLQYSPSPASPMSDVSSDMHKYFSDIVNQIKASCASDLEGNRIEDKPICSKKIIKHYVEEDDANSVVTNEDDDCISPGYHFSLPYEVHGSSYSTMQLISRSSTKGLQCPTVIITQHSFDIEAFTIFVAQTLCSTNNKKYGILYDSAYEIINVCSLSSTIVCVLVLKFTASDHDKAKKCQNCSTSSDCLIHRKLYYSKILFDWNMRDGTWSVLKYGKLKQTSAENYKKATSNNGGRHQNMLAKKLNKFTKKMFDLEDEGDDHLRILDSDVNKTKERLTDRRNAIEFFRRHPYDSPMSSIYSGSSNSVSSIVSFSSSDESDLTGN